MRRQRTAAPSAMRRGGAWARLRGGTVARASLRYSRLECAQAEPAQRGVQGCRFHRDSVPLQLGLSRPEWSVLPPRRWA